jgi:hypothetical protein
VLLDLKERPEEPEQDFFKVNLYTSPKFQVNPSKFKILSIIFVKLRLKSLWELGMLTVKNHFRGLSSATQNLW